MKKKLTILGIIISSTTFSQSYSTFYGTYDINANINQEINVSGTVNQNVNKTITSIDYGALAAANAQQESNRIKARIFADEREARIAEAIAADPFAAFTYASKWTQALNKRESKKQNRGFTDRTYWEFRIPHPLLFSSTTQFGLYRNTSESGVLTEISLGGVYNYAETWRKHGSEYKQETPKTKAEQGLKLYPVGQVSPAFKEYLKEEIFTHKAEISRAMVYGYNGFKNTIIYEDEYNYVIQEGYYSGSSHPPLDFTCMVKYSIPKTDGTFEDLEGRRHYLKRLCEEIIATAKFRYY